MQERKTAKETEKETVTLPPILSAPKPELRQRSTHAIAHHHNSLFKFKSPMDAGLKSIEAGIFIFAVYSAGVGIALWGGLAGFGVGFGVQALRDHCNKTKRSGPGS